MIQRPPRYNDNNVNNDKCVILLAFIAAGKGQPS